jgi:hypothetical protein
MKCLRFQTDSWQLPREQATIDLQVNPNRFGTSVFSNPGKAT